MEFIHLFLKELIITNYLFFLLLLFLFYVIYSYLKIWPRKIIIRIIDYEDGLFNLKNAKKIRCFINGKENKMKNNFICKRKLFGFLDKCEVSIEITSYTGYSIFKSEQKRTNRINYFEFYLSEEESKAFGKYGEIKIG